MPFITLKTGATLHYEDVNPQANLAPVVLIHGMLGIPHQQLANVMDFLAQAGYRVIAPTLRGYGASTPKPRDFPPRFYHRDAEDVLALVEALDLPKAHLLGYSDGGEIVLICAGTAPERFLSVAAWGAVGYFGAEFRAVAQRMIPGSAWLTADELAEHGMPPTYADAFALNWVRGTTAYLDLNAGDVSGAIAPRIGFPLLILLGTRDTLNPREYAERYLSQALHAPRKGVKMFDCGHPIHDEQPEAFKQAILEHLRAL